MGLTRLRFVSLAFLPSLVAPRETYRIITGDTLTYDIVLTTSAELDLWRNICNVLGCLKSLTTPCALYCPEYVIEIQSGSKKNMHTR